MQQMLDALLSAEIALFQGGRELREGELLKQVAKARRGSDAAEMLEALKSVEKALSELGEAGRGSALYKKVVAAIGD